MQDKEDSDNKLALHGIIQLLASLVKSFGTEAERYLNEPVLKKSDKKTYTQFWKGAASFYPILA